MKLTKLTLIIAAAALIPMASYAVRGGNPDENKYHLTTVRYIKENTKDHQYAVLIGRIVEKVGDETYILDDGTGRIKIDTSKKLPVGKRVVVRGRVDEDWTGITDLELDVKSWRLDRKKD
jgi:uncharacterized protein YdeI (BOF family)